MRNICLKPINTKKFIDVWTKYYQPSWENYFNCIWLLLLYEIVKIPLMLLSVSVMLNRHLFRKDLYVITQQTTIWTSGEKHQWRQIPMASPQRIQMNLTSFFFSKKSENLHLIHIFLLSRILNKPNLVHWLVCELWYFRFMIATSQRCTRE